MGTRRTLAIAAASVLLSIAPAATAEAQIGIAPIDDALGQVVDAADGVVATIDPVTGQVTDATGEVIGTLDPVTGTITDTAGEVVGTVDSTTGTIVGTTGEVIGTLAPSPGTGGGGQGGGTAPGSGGGQDAAPRDAVPLSLSLSGPRVQRLASASRRGVALGARCSRSCGVVAALTVGRTTARRLGLRARGSTVAVGSVFSSRSGRLALRLSGSARRALARYLGDARTRARLARRERAARAALRSARTRAGRTAARRRLVAVRRERRTLARRNVRMTLRAVAFDATGTASGVRLRSLTLRG